MKRVHILIAHDLYSVDTTIGKMYIAEVPDDCSWGIDNEAYYFCETLEDAVRAVGVKIKANTAIPQDVVYKVNVTPSSRFKRDMPIIYNQTNGYELESNGVSFLGVRFHGGNTHKNTEGCPLVAKNRNADSMYIQGTMEKELTAKIKEYISDGYAVYFKTVNT